MLFAQHFKAVHYLAHRHRCAVGIHPVKLVKHLLLIHRIFILDLKAVSHQQVTIGRIEFVYQIPRRLPCILNQGGALRLSLHAHRVVDIDTDEVISGVDIQLFLGMIWESEGQHYCRNEQATEQQCD